MAMEWYVSARGRENNRRLLTHRQVEFPGMDFANPMATDDVLTDFNFDAFLHDDAETGTFDFNTSYGGLDATGEIGAE